jgi:hypothetical protein
MIVNPDLTGRTLAESAQLPLRRTDVQRHVTVQVEAEHAADAGFTDDTVRTISENAQTLRFKDFGWEKEKRGAQVCWATARTQARRSPDQHRR